MEAQTTGTGKFRDTFRTCYKVDETPFRIDLASRAIPFQQQRGISQVPIVTNLVALSVFEQFLLVDHLLGLPRLRLVHNHRLIELSSLEDREPTTPPFRQISRRFHRKVIEQHPFL